MGERPGKTILVVEDNDAAREALAALLRAGGYDVLTAGDGEEGLAALGGGAPVHLVLLDMLMPVLDGWHFLKRLGGRPPAPPVPVVVTTGTILTQEWALSHGCRGFLRKPFEPEALLAEVRRCLAPA
jgi:CheY-like chemotaxis protein